MMHGIISVSSVEMIREVIFTSSVTVILVKPKYSRRKLLWWIRPLRGVSWAVGLRAVALVHRKCTCEVPSLSHIVLLRKLMEYTRGGITGELYKTVQCRSHMACSAAEDDMVMSCGERV